MNNATENDKGDFYGVIQHIYEICYPNLQYSKKVVLLYCNWFDRSNKGTYVNSKTNNVDMQMNKMYQMFDLFVITQNVRQIYYVSYPLIRPSKRGWCVAIKTKLTS